MSTESEESNHAFTGVGGLDEVLGGGLTPNRLYLLEGMPGSGKTTLALQFLLEGVRCGERVLYLTLSETEEEIRAVAASHGWSLEGLHLRELMATDGTLEPESQYTVFHPSEVELGDTTRRILDDVARLGPTRVVLDSLSELRLLAGDTLRYRRQILAMKNYFAGRQCTLLLLDDLTGDAHDLHTQSIAHGVILLEQTTPHYGAQRRRLSVQKFRGRAFRGGFHDYVIRRGGLEIFPRLVASEHRSEHSFGQIASGIAELDALLGGGLERGSSTLVTGAAGTAKSTLAALFARAVAERGENAALFLFDESIQMLTARMRSLGMSLDRYVDEGRILLRQVDPAELSPGEFAHLVREAATTQQCSVLVVDSLNGYLHAMPQEEFLIMQLHELLTYLGQKGVVTLLINSQAGLIGSMKSVVDASYLADSVVLTRYFEHDGEVRMAISVLKKRGSDFERTIREMSLAGGRLRVGKPLRGFQGVLTGVPTRVGTASGDAFPLDTGASTA